MSNEERAGGSDQYAALRAEWASAKPESSGIAAAVGDLNDAKLVGEGGVFERGPHVPIMHMAYFKPLVDAFVTSLKPKDRHSGKEWEYLNTAGFLTETGRSALSLARKEERGTEELIRLLFLADESFKAVLEVLSVRSQYLRNMCDLGVENAGQMGFLFEHNFDSVHYGSYRSAMMGLQGKVELEATKQCAKARLGQGIQKNAGAAGADSE